MVWARAWLYRSAPAGVSFVRLTPKQPWALPSRLGADQAEHRKGDGPQARADSAGRGQGLQQVGPLALLRVTPSVSGETVSRPEREDQQALDTFLDNDRGMLDRDQ